ncbi:hypothetical protein [Streptomyces sp. 3214.6]|uniref:hypothetical protein n=1 Tax=Streptomyces sp. 3214.6 TaxID=1882757 RepID=UPI001352101A
MQCAFGLDRRSRAQGVEIALLLSAAQKEDWRQVIWSPPSGKRHLRRASPRPTASPAPSDESAEVRVPA